MQITNEQRREVAATLTENIKDLYGSSELSEQIKILEQTIPVDKFNEFVLLIGDIILGFYTTAEMPGLLQSHIALTADQSQRITASFLDILSPVIAREDAALHAQKAAGKELAQTIESTHTEREASTPNSPTPATPVTANPHPDRVHGYGSYRENYRYGEEPEKKEDTPTIVTKQEDIL